MALLALVGLPVVQGRWLVTGGAGGVTSCAAVVTAGTGAVTGGTGAVTGARCWYLQQVLFSALRFSGRCSSTCSTCSRSRCSRSVSKPRGAATAGAVSDDIGRGDTATAGAVGDDISRGDAATARDVGDDISRAGTHSAAAAPGTRQPSTRNQGTGTY